MIICNGRPHFVEVYSVVEPKLRYIQSYSPYDYNALSLSVRGESDLFCIRYTKRGTCSK
jgi:hypothetical protein